jgi:hypothetical protein
MRIIQIAFIMEEEVVLNFVGEATVLMPMICAGQIP